MAKFVCSICGYVHEGEIAPEKCPVCLASACDFSEIKEEMVVEENIEETKDESIDSDSFTNPRLNDDVINEEDTTHEKDKSIKEEEEPCEVANLNLKNQMDSQLAPDEEEIINRYNSTHNNIEVIKWYMETYNIGLKEAKDRVDEVLIKHNLWNGGKIGGGCVVTILVAITSTLSLFLLL